MADDLVQEAFVRLWQGKNTPRELASFRPYLMKTVVNLARDYLRRQKRWSALRIFPLTPAGPAEEFERSARDADLSRAIRQLSIREREALYLRFFEDASYAEVAHALSAREATVRVLLYRTLRRLRHIMEREGVTSRPEQA